MDTNLSVKNIDKPAPKWFRITDGIIGDTEDLVLAVILVLGYSASAPGLVIYKIASSFIRRQLRRFLSNSEVYTKSDKNDG